MDHEKIRYFSMFTGVGGFELGLFGDRSSQQQGRRSSASLLADGQISSNQEEFYQCVGFSEIDKYASELLKKRYPNIPNFGDCTKINPSELPDFDMLCGGFPCQSFSIAGKRRGFQDTRGTMFFEIARILEVKRPKLILLENVKGLLNHDKGETFKVILQTLEELGYEIQWMVLNSKFFGVPQNRERVFIIGSLRGEPRPEILPFRTDNPEASKQPQTEVSNTITQRYYKQGNANTYVKCKGEPMIGVAIPGSQAQRVYTTDLAPTIKGLGGGGQGAKTGLYAIPTTINPEAEYLNYKIRRLTPTECERLQGFPDGWTEKGKVFKAVKLFGNIWKDVQFKNVTEKSVIENQNSVLNITKGGENGETLTLSIPSEEGIKESVELKGVIERHIVKNGVCNTINLGKDMVMLSKVRETSNYEEITKPNLMKERMEKQYTYPLWKITLEESSKKEKLSTILTLIKRTILSQTFTCVQTEKPITDVIIVWKKLEQNLLSKESLNLEMENTILMSDTQRYKMMGNAVTVNVIEAIAKKLNCKQKDGKNKNQTST